MKLKTKFQDEDFELGEVVDATISTTSLVDTHIKLKAKAKRGGEHMFNFSRISELFEMFEDYEEQKGSALDLMILTLTNFIENEPDEDKVDLEDCKNMLEKLKAWKRLKDKGFRFKTWGWDDSSNNEYTIYFTLDSKSGDAVDLDLLFSGEDD